MHPTVAGWRASGLWYVLNRCNGYCLPLLQEEERKRVEEEKERMQKEAEEREMYMTLKEARKKAEEEVRTQFAAAFVHRRARAATV